MLAIQSIHSFSTLVANEPAANETFAPNDALPSVVAADFRAAEEPAGSSAGRATIPSTESIGDAEYCPHLEPANDHRFVVLVQIPGTMLSMRQTPGANSDQSPATGWSDPQDQCSLPLNARTEPASAPIPEVPPVASLLSQAAESSHRSGGGLGPGFNAVPRCSAIPSVASLVAKDPNVCATGSAVSAMSGTPALNPPTALAGAETLQDLDDVRGDPQPSAPHTDGSSPAGKPQRHHMWARQVVDFVRPGFRYMRPGMLYLLVIPTVVGVNLCYEAARDTWRDYANAKASVASLQKQVADLQQRAPATASQPTQTQHPTVINGPGPMPAYTQYVAPAPLSMPMPLPDEPPARASSGHSVARAKQEQPKAATPPAEKSEIPGDGEFVLEKAGTKQSPASDFKLVGDK